MSTDSLSIQKKLREQEAKDIKPEVTQAFTPGFSSSLSKFSDKRGDFPSPNNEKSVRLR